MKENFVASESLWAIQVWGVGVGAEFVLLVLALIDSPQNNI